MKRIFTSILLILATAALAMAVPAHPGKYTYRQPDGTILILQNHGDEYFHWTTDQNGRIVEKGKDGFFRQVTRTEHEARRAKAAASARKAIWSSYEEHRATNFGDRKVLCILANFTDSTFVIDNPQQAFSDLLNKEGYDYNGAIGSVRDYYIDNSNGQYCPHFDVFGPVTLSNPSSYYDENGASKAILEAYEQLAAQINLDDYDTDSDGDIDMVLFYYPGHNEAEGAGKESIWPHQGTGNYGMMGSKKFNRYFCTSELKGARGNTMCSIGTTCHEFAHSLGLPDFYDVDYEKNGENIFTTNQFDLMSGGNYNDDGRKPPYLNAVERNMLGWMDYPKELSSGSFTLEPVRNDAAYTCPSTSGNEYFVLECRDNYKWDAAIGQFGLLVYHVDKSSRIVGGGKSAAELWESTNAINMYGGHPCFYIIEAAGADKYVFPGKTGRNTLAFTGWDGEQTGVLLNNIAFDGSKSSFATSVSYSRQVVGYVYDSSGEPLEGAEVTLSQSEYMFVPAKAPAHLSGDIVVYSGADGYFELSLADNASNYQILTACKEGYTPMSTNVPVESRFTIRDFYLHLLGEGEQFSLMRYTDDSKSYYITITEPTVAVAVHYDADELASTAAVGSTIETVAFNARLSQYEKVYVLIDIDNKRMLMRDVTDQYTTDGYTVVDVSDADITIPKGADLLLGYGVTGSVKENKYYLKTDPSEIKNGSWKSTDFTGSSTTWRRINWSDGANLSFRVAADLSTAVEPELNCFGVAFIKLENDVPVVVPPLTKTVYAVDWYLDGAAVDEPAALFSLPVGKHSYMAVLSYYDGTEERVYYDFTL